MSFIQIVNLIFFLGNFIFLFSLLLCASKVHNLFDETCKAAEVNEYNAAYNEKLLRLLESKGKI